MIYHEIVRDYKVFIVNNYTYSKFILPQNIYYTMLLFLLQCICYSHWANGDLNWVISIGQWGMINHEKGAIWQSHLAAQKKRELLQPLSSLITKNIKLDLSNLHYGPHYETQGCVIRENNITAPVTNPPVLYTVAL